MCQLRHCVKQQALELKSHSTINYYIASTIYEAEVGEDLKSAYKSLNSKLSVKAHYNPIQWRYFATMVWIKTLGGSLLYKN